MGLLSRFSEFFPSSTHPTYLPIGDECGDISPDVWREAPVDESDPVAVERRQRLRKGIWEAFMGTSVEVATHGSHCFPFNELPPDVVGQMPDMLRQSYFYELALCQDPRSGRIVRPYIPAGLVTPPNIE